jgi:four helix bundle protein
MPTCDNIIFNLEKRTFIFAKDMREYVEKLPKRLTNTEIGIQLIRSAGSVGANYIEANKELSRRNFISGLLILMTLI